MFIIRNMLSCEQQIVKIINKSLPAIVSISVFESKKKIENSANSVEGGTGFIIDRNGTVITNTHVIVKDKLQYQIRTWGGKTYLAKLISSDKVKDIAFLKIASSKETFKWLELGDSSKIKLGQTAIAVGNAFGIFQNTVSKGIISGLSRTLRASNKNFTESLNNLIQTDAAVNPGNSGGPLINSNGEVIGINSASMKIAENISFAVPINAAKKDLSDINRYGKVRRPFFGVHYVILNDELAKTSGIKFNSGALITTPSKKQSSVIPGSPANQAGIKKGDVITSINEKNLTAKYTIQDAIDKLSPGQKIKLEVFRKNKKMLLNAVLAEMI